MQQEQQRGRRKQGRVVEIQEAQTMMREVIARLCWCDRDDHEVGDVWVRRGDGTVEAKDNKRDQSGTHDGADGEATMIVWLGRMTSRLEKCRQQW